MKKSYVTEETLCVKTDIELGEIAQLIDVLQDVAGDENSTNWKAKELLRKLKSLRREAVEEARREFDNMLHRV